MAFLFLSDVRLLASFLGISCDAADKHTGVFFNGTFSFKTFRAHSLKQAKSCLSHCLIMRALAAFLMRTILFSIG